MAALRDTVFGWGLFTRLLHWALAGIILFQFGLGIWATNFVPNLFDRSDLTQLHKSWGVVAFGLAVARVFWRAANSWRRPPMPPAMPGWQRRAAACSHAALYLLMLSMPLSGWILVSASPLGHWLGVRSRFFGLFDLPDPIDRASYAIEHAAGAVHIVGAIVLGLLLILHVAAGLRHQVKERDGVLSRMISG
ncbi:MAG: cytochrome b/b6 domain-containing protein [Amaricoccus sp.]|uniref:cytochrome b n=1 Tax=Amaricoccus sp. TaxID=1872485 RepID=UPI0039E4719A